MQSYIEPVEGGVALTVGHFPSEGRGENINSHLFGNFQMFLSKVHGLLMIPQGGVGIS